ncbi:hypothetical protein [Microbacterium sp.]|uniref:hypothetical protein n=1 Tax=Microbacterium sp. TaxID=51671 RepID=UPI0035ADCF3C
MSARLAWTALLDRAEAAGEDFAAPESPFLDRVWADVVLALVPGSGLSPMSYCSHSRLAREFDDFDGVVIFAAQRLASCAACARSIRDEIEAGRKRTCLRCDVARADGMHSAELLTAAGAVVAIQLCSGCASAEGLLDAAVSP